MLTQPVNEMLENCIYFLDRLDDAEYVRKHPEVYNASIGAHYRHVIDHLIRLIHGVPSKLVNYDKRERDEEVEKNRSVARARTMELLECWKTFEEQNMSEDIDVVGKVSYADEAPIRVRSTIGRESMYVVIHAVHHFALIGVICKLAKIPQPQGFGVAPSTVEYQRELAKSS